ncbi:hypothetical protein QE152_g25373 [Popillia japonica]|uniref:Uncharacterized protein n=1 Tax=Popillia japonica TaxID=7064 RepID=A0AAW1K276_POPJA
MILKHFVYHRVVNNRIHQVSKAETKVIAYILVEVRQKNKTKEKHESGFFLDANTRGRNIVAARQSDRCGIRDQVGEQEEQGPPASSWENDGCERGVTNSIEQEEQGPPASSWENDGCERGVTNSITVNHRLSTRLFEQEILFLVCL